MSDTMKFNTFFARFSDPAPDPVGFQFQNPARSSSGRTWKSGIR